MKCLHTIISANIMNDDSPRSMAKILYRQHKPHNVFSTFAKFFFTVFYFCASSRIRSSWLVDISPVVHVAA